MRVFAAILLLLVGFCAPALADGEIGGLITESDRLKLAEFNTAKLSALREAEAGSAGTGAETLTLSPPRERIVVQIIAMPPLTCSVWPVT